MEKPSSANAARRQKEREVFHKEPLVSKFRKKTERKKRSKEDPPSANEQPSSANEEDSERKCH